MSTKRYWDIAYRGGINTGYYFFFFFFFFLVVFFFPIGQVLTILCHFAILTLESMGKSYNVQCAILENG